MKNNPFSSETFVKIWSQHFANSIEPITFNFIPNLSFIKNKYFPVFINIGKNWTKAMSYDLKESPEKQNLGNKVLFIYDVPNYLENKKSPEKTSIRTRKVRQYQGFLANLKNFSSLEDYMSDRFDSKSRYKFRRNKQRLESCFSINETLFFGDIAKNEYDRIFTSFRSLLEKAFNKKQVNTNILDKWEYYHQLVYPMIIEKRASLYVLSNEDVPICIALNFHSDTHVFLFFSVYNSDYSKFGIGYLSVMKCIEWCIDNNVEGYDFSKGYFLYKSRWSNVIYDFNYHVIYNSNSLISIIIANNICYYFRIKQFLREKELNRIYNKLMFLIKTSSSANGHNQQTLEFGKITELDQHLKMPAINFEDSIYSNLRRPIYDFLYTTGNPLKELNVFKSQDSYWLVGRKKMQKITVKD